MRHPPGFLKQWIRSKEPLVLQPNIARQLAAIEPSICGILRYYPCLVTLKGGATLDQVYCVEQENYMRMWGIHPLDDPAKSYLPISRVISLTESPSRLPTRFANRLYASPESRMGGEIFTVVFSDGLRQAYITGNAVDFIPYPKGQTPGDVIDVLANVGAEAKPLEGLNYHWCLYVGNVPNLQSSSSPVDD